MPAAKLTPRQRQEVVAALMYASKPGMSWANCMAYALQVISPSSAGPYKLQPGHLAGDDRPVDLRDCSDLRRKLAKDGRMKPKPDRGCPRGTHEIAAYLAPGVDYHFITKSRDVVVHFKPGTTVAQLASKFGVKPAQVRMIPKLRMALLENANLWTHKPGTTAVQVTDSCGKPITNPDEACRGSGRLNYTTPCGRYCARNPSSKQPVTIQPADLRSSSVARNAAHRMTQMAANLSKSV